MSEVDLIAVLVAVSAGQPRVLTLLNGDALPSGPFEAAHRSPQAGLRAWVEAQTHHPLGFLEQLYTFADRDRVGPGGQRAISISYLGLTREAPPRAPETCWLDWYAYFPWEDHRDGPPAMIAQIVEPALAGWAGEDAARAQRMAINFGLLGRRWNEELVLPRYELLYEVGLLYEAGGSGVPGRPMAGDHRRILATAIARLRAKIKYRPVVFELMADSFTLLQLQRSVEGIAGRAVHKQNFRRLVEQQDLVEETGEVAADTGGRPAKLFRFRRDVLAERAAAGTRLPLIRA